MLGISGEKTPVANELTISSGRPMDPTGNESLSAEEIPKIIKEFLMEWHL